MELRPGTMEEAGINPGKMQLAEKYIEDYIKAGETYAFHLLAARHGIVFYHKVFGKASHEPDAPPLRKDTIFPMASVTKPFTATAAMILFEEGKLDIDKPIQYYVPEFIGENKEKGLVRQLMTHTSGMADDTVWNWFSKNKATIKVPPPEKNQNQYMAENIYCCCNAPLWNKPGLEMSYANFSAILPGDIIRRVSGQSYPGFIKERILDPLGMKDTYIPVPLNVRERIIKRPAEKGGAWFTSPYCLDGASPAFGLYSVGSDIAAFCQMFLNKGSYNGIKILSPETVKDMTRNHLPGICSHFQDEYFPEACWGLGWDIPFGKTTCGNLVTEGSFTHGGNGGSMMFGDFKLDLLWVRLCVHVEKEPRPITGILSDMIIQAIES